MRSKTTNFSDLQARAAQLVSYEGYTDTSPAPDWPTMVNRGLVDYAWDAETTISEYSGVTVNNQEQYTLNGINPANWKRLLMVEVNGMRAPLSSEAFETFADPDWNLLQAGTPAAPTLRAFLVRPNLLRILPPPNGVFSLYARGFTEAPPLSAGSDIPAFPSKYHEAIALRAAVLVGKIWARGEAGAYINQLDQEYQRYVADFKALDDEEQLAE